MRTDPVSIATPPADRSDGSHYPETVLQTPSATSVQMYTGRGSGWISTGGRFSQHVPSSSNPAKIAERLNTDYGTVLRKMAADKGVKL